MSKLNKPNEAGFKPGANMPAGATDPRREGMQSSGNHASGHAANDMVRRPDQGAKAPFPLGHAAHPGNEAHAVPGGEKVEADVPAAGVAGEVRKPRQKG